MPPCSWQAASELLHHRKAKCDQCGGNLRTIAHGGIGYLDSSVAVAQSLAAGGSHTSLLHLRRRRLRWHTDAFRRREKTRPTATKAGAEAIKALATGMDKIRGPTQRHGKMSATRKTMGRAGKNHKRQYRHEHRICRSLAPSSPLQIAQQNQALHQEQIDNLQKQIDFLNSKFTNDSLYDWMVSSLSATYFQSYQLAYQMCKQVERCYQFELGIQNSSFIQFGYWDSLYKGLLAGETLNHDLRRMQSSYLQQNKRRYEIEPIRLPGGAQPDALCKICWSTDPATSLCPSRSSIDDYPGHYNRRLTRMSVTVVYPSPGKFDNIKATLTMVSNQVRSLKTDVTSDYPETPRRLRIHALSITTPQTPQKIVMGNAQDDPGLFITAIASNIADQRYLPFENAGAVELLASGHAADQQRSRSFHGGRHRSPPLLHGSRRGRRPQERGAGEQSRQPSGLRHQDI